MRLELGPEPGRLLVYAPNVHTGGGLVLLRALLDAWPSQQPLRAWLDARARAALNPPGDAQVDWVAATLAGRLSAELSLRRAARACDRLLCLHGLPPLLRSRATLSVFLQNRLHLDPPRGAAFGWRTGLRLVAERCQARWLRHRVSSYWVQTPTMQRALQAWYGPGLPPVHVLAFAPSAPARPPAAEVHWDFVYVADGEAHKNHRRLIEAWVLMAQQGLRPSLALTLHRRDAELSAWVAGQARQHQLRVSDLGELPHERIQALYGQARALIFPSLLESFGLPLVEARAAGLPILAGELDFVRDVCEPVQSFDPGSPISIAGAVRRFLGQAQPPQAPVGAAEFLQAVRGEAA